MTNGLKLMILSAGTLITCMVVTVAMQLASTSRSTASVFGQRLNDLHQVISQSSLSQYDGVIIYGADVVNIIKKELGRYGADDQAPVMITVRTEDESSTSFSYQNRSYFSDIQNFTKERYIHPLHRYQGSAVYNKNNVLIELVFTLNKGI